MTKDTFGTETFFASCLIEKTRLNLLHKIKDVEYIKYCADKYIINVFTNALMKSNNIIMKDLPNRLSALVLL